MSKFKTGKSIINTAGDVVGLEVNELLTPAELKKWWPDKYKEMYDGLDPRDL